MTAPYKKGTDPFISTLFLKREKQEGRLRGLRKSWSVPYFSVNKKASLALADYDATTRIEIDSPGGTMRIQSIDDYSPHYFAFLDILGFSDHIARIESGETQPGDLGVAMSRMKNALARMKEVVREQFATHLVAQTFSDSIAIFSPVRTTRVFEFLFAVNVLQQTLLNMKILVRGGISIGNIYWNPSERVLFGGALIDAYKLEKSANYPRIVLSGGLIRERYEPWLISNQNDQQGQYALRNLAKKDFDGVWYLERFTNRMDGHMETPEEWLKVKRIIEKQLEETRVRSPGSAFFKICWLANKFNDALKTYRNELDGVTEIVVRSP